MNWSWLALVPKQTSSVLSIIQGAAPLVGIVSTAIQTAEGLRHARGADKLRHAQQLVADGAAALNAAAGHTVVDPTVVQHVAAEAISTIVDTSNMIHLAHGSAAASL